MTYSNTYSSPSSPTNFIPFSGMGMRKGGRATLMPSNYQGDGSTLSLDFTTMGGVLDPRLTFSRASTATFVNSSGYVDHAGANLLLYSAYADTNWVAYGTYVKAYTTGITSPIGDTTAARITFDAVGKGLYYNSASLGSPNVVGATYTMSAWIRATGSTTNPAIRFGDSGVAIGGNIPITTTWTRYSLTYTNAVSSSSPAIQSASGTATGEFEMWGFQLNPGSTAQTYYPTTTAAYYAPRFDYSPTNIGEPRGLLIEGQAINYMLYSTALNPHSTFNMRTIATASITDPEGTTDKARIVAADGATGYHVRFVATTAGTNTTITISIFAKKNGYKYLHLAEGNSGRSAVLFDLDDGTTSNSAGPGFVSASAISYPNGWWRCSMVVSVTASTSYAWGYVGVPTTGATLGAYGAQYTGANTDTAGIYCYGFQVEAGSGASSYIPTGASGVTRNAEACSLTGSNFTNVFGDGSLGTITCSHEFPRADRGVAHQPTPFGLGSYTAANARGYSYANYAVGIGGYGWVYTSASFGSATTSAVSVAKNKCGLSYNGLAITAALNGTTASSTGTGTITVSSAVGLQIGYNTTPRDFINACVSNIKFYPTALTAAQLQTLTAP